ncbi:Ig-like domain-containing protein [Microbacterium sp. NPDC058345]|uniref:Ig-like domain-containing protein n=1 Tax=Microbacterium sp. NPDC058345 TaxID=3346455 RepID=UPI00365A9127
MNLNHRISSRRRGRAIGSALAALALLSGGIVATQAVAADDENVALATTENAPDVEVSYVPGWNSAAALNDGDNAATDNLSKMWGTWGAPGGTTEDTATYTWETPVTVSSSALYLWQNFGTGDGGVRLPESWNLQYQNEDGEWRPVAGDELSYPLPDFDPENPVGSFPAVTATFDSVTTTAMRLTVVRSVHDGSPSATSVIEWEVWGRTAPEEPEEPENPDDFILSEEVSARTTTGAAPRLPEEVWLIDENGPLHYEAVTWDAVPAEQYGEPGSFTVSGSVTGYPNQSVSATVYVADALSDAIEEVEYASSITTPGVAPVLPKTVVAHYDDGTASSEVPVEWDSIDPAAYADVDAIFDVSGDVTGHPDGAIATVFVVEPVVQTEPIVSIAFDEAPQGSGWYTVAPVAEVTAQPTASPIERVEISTDGGATWSAYEGPFTVTQQGDVTVMARAQATDGATGAAEAAVRVDTAAPVTKIDVTRTDGTSALVTLTPTDAEPGSGVSRTMWSDGPDESPTGGANNMYATYEEPFSVQLTAEPRYVHVRSQDAAGNEEETQTVLLPAVEQAVPDAPEAPVAEVDGHRVTVEWEAPESSAPLTGYTVFLVPEAGLAGAVPGQGDLTEISMTTDADTLSATFEDVPDGIWRAVVVATSAVGDSERSPASAAVAVGDVALPGGDGDDGDGGTDAGEDGDAGGDDLAVTGGGIAGGVILTGLALLAAGGLLSARRKRFEQTVE